MDKQRLYDYLNRFALPVLVIACGVILIFSPDSASALISGVLGWGLFAAGIIWGLVQLSAHARLSRFLGAAVCILAGLWLINHPLALAKTVGVLAGVLLAVRGIQELRNSVSTQGKVLSLAVLVLGIFLLLVPMSASRLVIILLGAVVLVVGVGMLLERLNHNGGNWLDSGDDPNIIDAL